MTGSGIHLCGPLRSARSSLLHLALSWRSGDTVVSEVLLSPWVSEHVRWPTADGLAHGREASRPYKSRSGQLQQKDEANGAPEEEASH